MTLSMPVAIMELQSDTEGLCGTMWGPFGYVEHLKGPFCLDPAVRLDKGLLQIRVLLEAFSVSGGHQVGQRLNGVIYRGNSSREFFTLCGENMFSFYLIRLNDSAQVTNEINDGLSFGVCGQIRIRRRHRRSYGTTRGPNSACKSSVYGSALCRGRDQCGYRLGDLLGRYRIRATLQRPAELYLKAVEEGSSLGGRWDVTSEGPGGV